MSEKKKIKEKDLLIKGLQVEICLRKLSSSFMKGGTRKSSKQTVDPHKFVEKRWMLDAKFVVGIIHRPCIVARSGLEC